MKPLLGLEYVVQGLSLDLSSISWKSKLIVLFDRVAKSYKSISPINDPIKHLNIANISWSRKMPNSAVRAQCWIALSVVDTQWVQLSFVTIHHCLEINKKSKTRKTGALLVSVLSLESMVNKVMGQ